MRIGDLRRVQKPQSLKLDLFSGFSMISSWEYGDVINLFSFADHSSCLRVISHLFSSLTAPQSCLLNFPQQWSTG